MRTQITIQQARAAYEALKTSYDLKLEIMNLICDAEENADETVYGEKAAPESERDDVAVRTLASHLCESYISPAARKFFDDLGLVY
jgi:hypothetical protein